MPIAQARGRLVAALFEPTGPDSFVRWGFFNACFERKEYMEAYVAEAVAERMLASDPSLRAEFTQRLASRGIDYRLGLITFSDRVERRVELDEDVNKFISWIFIP